MNFSRRTAVCLMGLLVSTAAVSISAQAPARATGLLIELNKPGTIEVAVSLGKEDGVKAGDKLHVIHAGQVVGKLEITKAYADRSTAKIVEVAPGTALSTHDEAILP